MASVYSLIFWAALAGYIICLLHFLKKIGDWPICDIPQESSNYKHACFEPLLTPFTNGSTECSNIDSCVPVQDDAKGYEMTVKFYTYYAHKNKKNSHIGHNRRKKNFVSELARDREHMQLQWSSFVFISKNYSVDIELQLEPPSIEGSSRLDPKRKRSGDAGLIPILKGVLDINPEGYDSYRNEHVISIEFDLTTISNQARRAQTFNLLDGNKSNSKNNGLEDVKRPKHLLKFSRSSPIKVKMFDTGDRVLSTNWIEGLGHSLETRLVEQDSNEMVSHYQKMYDPIFFIDEIDLFASRMQLYKWQSLDDNVNDSNKSGNYSVNVTLSIELISNYYFMFKKISQSTIQLMSNANMDEEIIDEIKYWFSDEKIKSFLLTQILVWAHIVFEYLAFKDDWLFFKGRASFKGISISSLFFSLFKSTVIFLYLLDMETSWLVLGSLLKDIIFVLYKSYKILTSKMYLSHESLIIKRKQTKKDDKDEDDQNRINIESYSAIQGNSVKIVAELETLEGEGSGRSELQQMCEIVDIPEKYRSHPAGLIGNLRNYDWKGHLPNTNSIDTSQQRYRIISVEEFYPPWFKLPVVPYYLCYSNEFRGIKDDNDTLYLDYIAIIHVSIILLPLAIGMSIYSLKFYRFKSWWSWFISSLSDFVYFFGFISLTPQLYINYKLKSVAHLPLKAFFYKIFITFIDDVFAFIVKSPLKHKIMTFRDDLIFLIFLYQWYIYPNDKSRSNEFGFAYENPAAQKETAPIESNGDLAVTNGAKVTEEDEVEERNEVDDDDDDEVDVAKIVDNIINTKMSDESNYGNDSMTGIGSESSSLD